VKSATQFARAVSSMGHPLVVVTVSVGIVAYRELRAACAVDLTGIVCSSGARWLRLRLSFWRRSRISELNFHCTRFFAFYCGAVLFRINPFLGGVALALALILFWSRLYLQRMIWRKCRPELCSDWAAAWSQFGGREE